jgi:predicted acetyltransferase
MRPGDIPAVIRLYNRENASRTGSALRARDWKGFPRSAGFFVKPDARILADGRGRLKAYMVLDRDAKSCRVSEIGGSASDSNALLLNFLEQRALSAGTREITAVLPPDHPFSAYCRTFGCEVGIRYPRNGGFMGRIIDQNSCLAKIAKGLENSGISGTLALATELGRHTLRVGRGSSPSAPLKLGQAQLFQLLLGYRSASDLKTAGDLRASRSQVALLEDWFPQGQAHLWWADRF